MAVATSESAQTRWRPVISLQILATTLRTSTCRSLETGLSLHSAIPLMKGFVRNYATINATHRHGASVMKCFAPASLPVLTTLATQFAVCDRWFSSVPGPTVPNRMFTHGGWSLGLVEPDPDLHDLKTIFEVFDREMRGDYRIYHHDGFTVLLSVGHLIEDQHGFRDYNRFVSDCAKGDLPAYTIIEPRYANDTLTGSFFAANDQHPNHDVMEGERLIRDVYTAIRGNDALWPSTLLLIVHDEHGGIFDHVPPPAIAAWDPTLPGFKFDRLGVRVPAVLVSPFIPPRTIMSTPVRAHVHRRDSVEAVRQARSHAWPVSECRIVWLGRDSTLR